MIRRTAFLFSALTLAAPGWAAPLPAALQAPLLQDLAIRSANPAGTLQWAAWSTGAAASETVHLALLSTSLHRTALWTTTWPGAYEPSLTLLPNWVFDGTLILAATVQYGAAAAELDLFGLDAHGKPVKLASETAAAVGWTIDSAGNQLVVLYAMPASALVPACFAWTAGSLTKTACPPAA